MRIFPKLFHDARHPVSKRWWIKRDNHGHYYAMLEVNNKQQYKRFKRCKLSSIAKVTDVNDNAIRNILTSGW